ncbi:MAG: hypothetical protein Fur0032_24020 [Terrimicrobiaceae bacterium]
MKKAFHPPRALKNASHYRQPAFLQPVARVIEKGTECVEVVTGGRGWVWHERQWREVVPGDLIWNGAGDQTIGRSDPKRPYSCLALVFEVGPRQTRPPIRFSLWPDISELRRFTDEVVSAFWDNGFPRDVLCEFCFWSLVFRVECAESMRRAERYPDGIREALDEIDTSFAGRLSVARLASLVGWSVPHLHEEFRKHVGSTPHQMIMQRRLRDARERLLTTRSSVKEIGHASGFGDPAAFVRAFKKMTGVTPAAFRLHYLHGGGR